MTLTRFTWGDSGGSSKIGEDEKPNVVVKIFTGQIPTLVHVSHVPTPIRIPDGD